MTLLLLDGVVGGYGRIEVLRGVSLRVDEGEIVALLGANGAGKTTTVRTISGLLPTWRGTISFDGHAFGRSSAPERRAALGLGHLYRDGLTVQKDEVLALAYYEVAIRQGLTSAAKSRDELAARMNPQDVASARTRAESLFAAVQQ